MHYYYYYYYLLTAGFCGFQPKKKGMYVVDVIQDGAKFPGSPFQIQIGDTEVCSPSKVKVSGAVREGMSQQWNDVTINVTDAGQILVTGLCLIARRLAFSAFTLASGRSAGL